MGRKRLDFHKLIKRQAHCSKDDHCSVKKNLESRKSAEQIKRSLMKIRNFQIRFAGPSGALPHAKHSEKKKSTESFFHMSSVEFVSIFLILFGCILSGVRPREVRFSPDFAALIRNSARKSCGAKRVFIFATQCLSFAP